MKKASDVELTASVLAAAAAREGETMAQEKFNRVTASAALEQRLSGQEEGEPLSEKEKYQRTIFFPIGAANDAYAQYFSGQSYLAPLSSEQVAFFNVTFEPGCRNNWHIHHAQSGGGQILICVGGHGYYQEWGREAVEMTPGSIVNIPAEVKHWHGAAPDSWFSHIAIEVSGEGTSNEWCEPVSAEEYAGVTLRHEQGK